ncbi:MAG: flagellar biosynthesis protein FlhA [Gammaproteobacteria bacterium CG22_combo_CG10-13_8_21_14_all_40_8]|nr:MAG: flagellar biosynthesis protein FlhA [Gammaproteobacteria bacterium CG22_combo_CG10-13_8_21_14_all_40_8]
MADVMALTKKQFKLSGLGTPIVLLAVLAMMVLPMPPLFLDLMFTFNITLALVVVLVTVYTKRPVEFAAFPTILLVTTLLRLSLNVASTRVVLLEGHQGPSAAGHVIESFGSVVVGGNYAVGLVVFAILILINFVVVTKGAGRISEVSARFTLDAMPGKQMSIDADLNAGLLTQEAASARREEIAMEADFYGAMDGASKFVRGDAVAGVMILFINILGGVAIGMGQHDLDFSTAIRFYALLTIGDGLVAQIPSLLLSTAAAIMVTRQNVDHDIGEQVIGQMLSDPRALYISALIMGMLGIIPGMPHVAFLGLGSVVAVGGYFINKSKQDKIDDAELVAKKAEPAPKDTSNELKELSWDDVEPVDPIGLEVGYRLIPMVDKAQDGKLMSRIKGVRKKLSQELGFLISTVHIRDNLELSPNGYRISLMGVPTSEAEVYPDRELAINPGQVFGRLEGIATKDPAFGLEAFWISPDQKEQAQTLGYTVVDASTVVATHLSQLLQDHAASLLGHEEAEQILKRLAVSAPKLAEELVPGALPLSILVKILQNLLSEHIPVRDIRTIAETLAEYAPRSQDPDALTSQVRVALGRMIVQTVSPGVEEMPVITIEPSLEQILQKSIQVSGAEGGIEPMLAEKLQQSLKDVAQKQEMEGQPAVLLVNPALRLLMARFSRYAAPNMHVLSYHEIPDNKQIRIVATVGQ